ncbi:MAG: T9SS C-terminal target domain-containing protein [Cytophagales bacterium]|nr:MAG: T9SS C-terminal target domain-containing protein [Cytophagales bacterium]
MGVQQPLIISALTGIKGSEKLMIACQIYPNPSSDFVVLSWDSALNSTYVNYKIADVNGKNIILASAQNQSKISVLDLAIGTYIINVSDSKNNFIKSFKLVKN